LLAEARRLRAKTAAHPMTDRELAKAKTAGRLSSGSGFGGSERLFGLRL